MKKVKRYDIGGEVDALEAANASPESQAISDEAKGDSMLKAMRDEASKPKMSAKPKSKEKSFDQKAKKENFTSAETGGGAALMYRKPMGKTGSGSTDTRSVGERLRDALGAGKNRGGNTVDFGGSGMGMKKGGKVSSASSRADGIAQRGKTRGKMIMCGGGRT
jgi:hypothetical protein